MTDITKALAALGVIAGNIRALAKEKEDLAYAGPELRGYATGIEKIVSDLDSLALDAEREKRIEAWLATANRLLDSREPAEHGGDPREWEETFLNEAVTLMRSCPPAPDALAELRAWIEETQSWSATRNVLAKIDELRSRASAGTIQSKLKQ